MKRRKWIVEPKDIREKSMAGKAKESKNFFFLIIIKNRRVLSSYIDLLPDGDNIIVKYLEEADILENYFSSIVAKKQDGALTRGQ